MELRPPYDWNALRDYLFDSKEEICLNDLSSALCDAYDIKDRLRAYDIKDKPKDADGSDTTVGDCIDDIINFLEQLEK